MRVERPGTEYRNANIYNGHEFQSGSFYTVDGKFLFNKPDKVSADSVIDLKSQFVIPPFAEAHNHNLESSHEIDERIAQYFRDGVFYVKLQSSIKKRITPLMDRYNHPRGLDISQAMAPITGYDGHPMGVRKSHLESGFFGNLFQSLEEIEGHGFVRVANLTELKGKWPSIISKDPDFIKVILNYSEEYEKRKDDKAYFGHKGIDPALVPKLVNMAHADGLRVSAHVFTVYDFQVAVQAGVDEIAHLPGYINGGRIREEDAKEASKKGIVQITTASLAQRAEKSANYEELLQDIRANLNTLRKHGVILAIGSDMYNDTSVGEVNFLRRLNVFNNQELLDMWCKNSAQTIFPDRKIGELKEGYEASFLVLSGNPLEDWENTRRIVMRVKQGVVLP